MRTWAPTRARLPPEPWLSRTAAPLREGTYQAESRRPSRMAMRTSSCGMPTADSSIAQRGACVTWLARLNGIRATGQIAAPAIHPTAWAARQARPARPGAPARRRHGREARGDEQQPAERYSRRR